VDLSSLLLSTVSLDKCVVPVCELKEVRDAMPAVVSRRLDAALMHACQLEGSGKKKNCVPSGLMA
jgi:hypothetical protein